VSLQITVETRYGDYMAYLDGDKCKWGCGDTIEEAIGSVIRAWCDINVSKAQKRPPGRPDQILVYRGWYNRLADWAGEERIDNNGMRIKRTA